MNNGPSKDAEVLVKSYRYLRSGMVAMLVGLAVAVVYQSVQQGFLLGSISAYYYTPAQAIFVGALIALALAMIALQGKTPSEDVFLNLGGMLAAVVAIVPTARSADFTAAVHACRADNSIANVDCPTVTALADATQANVQNNMVALFVIGLLGLVATVVFALRDYGSRWRRGLVAAICAAVVLYAAAIVAFAVSVSWFVDSAHYLAAIGLFLCMIVVVVANAIRHHLDATSMTRAHAALASYDRYAWIAWGMVAVAVGGAVLWLTGFITLFWVETAVIVMFGLFWVVQTTESWRETETVSSPATTTRPAQAT